MSELNPIAEEYLGRLKDSIERTSALGRISYWLEKNTTLAGKPFSFKGHEFQREIVDETHPNACVIKPSQVGLSECTARLMLGFVAISPDTVGIYTLPTVHEALRFSKSRIDTVIRSSRYLSSIIIGGSDSSSFKQLGTSQIFMAGTFGKALISIPTDILLCDEVDFSNPEVLVTAESRLSHSRIFNEELEIRGIRRKFSTPTLPQMGVSALYDKSDQRRRLVRCKHCGHWFWPNFLHHVVVPGYSGDMAEITYLEVQDLDDRGLLTQAKLLCEKCHGIITKENLRPEYREWVAEFPHVKHSRGYSVSPFDLPDYHTPTSILRKKLEFKEEEGHFRNFTLGLGFADASNSVLPGVVKANTNLAPSYPDSTSAYGCIMGLDVGKTSWLTVGKLVGDHLHVIWTEQIKIGINREDELYNVVCLRMQQFRVIKLVCDAMPYTDTMLRIQGRFAPGQVMLCTYTLTDTRTAISRLRETDYTLEANRTKSIDVLVKKLNTGKVKFAALPDTNLIESHLQGMKRMDRLSPKGEVVAEWLKASPDHYFHSLNYLNLASREIESSWANEWSPGLGITQAMAGSQAEKDRPSDPLHLFRK
jgi:hypothetical protein